MNLEEIISEEHLFKVKRLTVATALDLGGIMITPERIRYKVIETGLKPVLQGIVTLLVQEEPLCKYPADWWQHFKLRWFPKWLKRKAPVQYTEAIACHKYPELEPPTGVLGREFVHLRLVNPDKLTGNKNTE